MQTGNMLLAAERQRSSRRTQSKVSNAKEYPELCQLTEDDEQGGLRFELDKHRIGIRLTAPYSPERRESSRRRAKSNPVTKSGKVPL